ncbi:unnamed protein product [Parnassius apollo]|uniref:(apollo) hypothetical protein n=1 Tax=Parnassius apollo TaxID=110799 RepID=A0A8S3W8B9_PARAO|nr:unnamed protein product [Parnassius apollo]
MVKCNSEKVRHIRHSLIPKVNKCRGTIFISNNNEVGEIQQYVEENSLPLNKVHNRGVEQAINMESCTDDRWRAY